MPTIMDKVVIEDYYHLTTMHENVKLDGTNIFVAIIAPKS